ncbi:hypothetical protein [Sphingobacterium sp.]|uniref:hypothetical protein n=1 Tax=Sphingobacterium sp. TaxID=341027 RepID=UPI0028B11775|nr:hypothetical protein [Sphingobacterium sp.]
MKYILIFILFFISSLTYGQNLSLEQIIMLKKMNADQSKNYLQKKNWKIVTLTKEQENILMVLTYKPENDSEYMANKIGGFAKSHFTKKNEETRIYLLITPQKVIKSISMDIYNPQIFKKYRLKLKSNKYYLSDNYFRGEKMIQLYKGKSSVIHIVTTKVRKANYQKINLWKFSILSKDYYYDNFAD